MTMLFLGLGLLALQAIGIVIAIIAVSVTIIFRHIKKSKGVNKWVAIHS